MSFSAKLGNGSVNLAFIPVFKPRIHKIYIVIIYFIHLNKVLQKFSTARPSSSVAKHKLLRDTKKQQDVITSNRVIMTS